MESRIETLEFINSLLLEENATPLEGNQRFADAGLDSLGTVFLLMALDQKYKVLKGVPSGEEVEYLGLETITMKALVNKCRNSE